MKDKLPALQFYTGDWRKDPCVQALDHEHKGVWIDLLCILNETSERGRLVLPNGNPMPDEAIARNLGLTEAKWKQIRSNLLGYGVASEDGDGVLYNRRIVRDQATREARAEAGRKGGKKSRPKQGASKTEAKQEANRGSSVSSSFTTSVENASEKVRASRLPEDWTPTDEHINRAKNARLDLQREVDKFRAHAEENDRRAKSWNGAFTRWLINAEDYARRDGTKNTPRKDAYDGITLTREQLKLLG